MHKLILPLPPSLNHAYITTKTGKRIMTNTMRQYKESVSWQVKAAVKKPYPKLNKISYVFYHKDNRVRDIDNLLKGIRDCLKGTLVVDDCWQRIHEENIKSAGIDRKNPRVEICWEI